MLLHDGVRRGGYWRKTASFGEPTAAEALRHASILRDDLRQAARQKLTAVGQAFSEFLQPSGTVAKEPRIHPGRSNRLVDALGIACIVVGATLLVATAMVGAGAGRSGYYLVALAEAVVGFVATIAGLSLARRISDWLGQARRAQLYGVVTILLSGVLGALVGGFLGRLLVCTIR